MVDDEVPNISGPPKPLGCGPEGLREGEHGPAILDRERTAMGDARRFDWSEALADEALLARLLRISGPGGRDCGFDAAMADFDGDGADDLAIGIPRDIYFGFDRPERVAIFRGPLSPGTYTEESADAIWFGSEEADAFGLRLATGDVDDDGRQDLAVGAPYDSDYAEEAGSVTLLLGGGL